MLSVFYFECSKSLLLIHCTLDASLEPTCSAGKHYFCQITHLLFNTAILNRVLFHLQLMSHRTLSLALHCSMSLSLHSLIILFKLPSIPRQMTNRFVAFMISFFFPRQIYIPYYRVLPISFKSGSFSISPFRIIQDIFMSWLLLCCLKLNSVFPFQQESSALKSSGRKSGRPALLFNQHMKKNILGISFSLS